MLHKLSSHISDCLARAAEAGRKAEEAKDARRRADFLFQERNWTNLAESFQFAESVDRFLHGGLEVGEGWQLASSAPFGQWLELAVIDRLATHAVVFPCCRTADGWIEARTGRPIDVAPTHWREWMELGPRDGEADGGEEGMPSDEALVIFQNDQASLRVALGDDDSFELIVRVHGEEVTAYDLDGDRLAMIGRRLLTLANRAAPTPQRDEQTAAGAVS